jgi:tetratricopeptide (TPR) repeat protein/DNA-binding SARP family transcriptional activator
MRPAGSTAPGDPGNDAFGVAEPDVATDVRWSVHLSGETRVVRASETDRAQEPVEIVLRPKERAVVAALGADHPEVVPLDEIAERIWGRQAPQTAVTSIRNHVARIRRTAPGLVLTAGNSYRLAPTTRIVWEAEPGGAGQLLADLADTPEMATRRHLVEERLADAVDAELVEALRSDGSPATVERLRVAVGDRPYRELRWSLLAVAQARSGHRRDALLTLQRARAVLGEVGLDPGEQLLRVEQAVLGDGAIDIATVFPPAGAHARARSTLIHPHRTEPFVGRTDALDVLETVWTATVDQRRPHLAVVAGPAGSGKTRLVDEFVRRATEADPAVRVLWGRHRASATRAFGALAEALGRLFDDEPDLADRRTGRSALVRLAAVDGAGALDDGADDPHVRTRLGRELAQLLGRLAQRPTIWFLDDVQWASPDSLALVEEAIDGTTGPVLLVTTMRLHPAPASDLFGSLGRVLPAAHVTVAPLRVDELDRLVRATEGVDAEPATVEQLHRRTGGLALYASEILRSSRRTGRLEAADIPLALQEWMRHRVDALPPAAAETLRAAALLDDEVDAVLVAAATGQPEREVAGRCDELVALDLLTVDPATGRSSFSHELTREVVRNSIGPMARVELERRIADALLHVRPDAHALLARHFHRAHDARAFTHAIRAGDAGLALGAWRHATEMFEIASHHAATGAEHASALVGCGRALLGDGDAWAARAALTEAVELARDADRPEVRAQAALALVGRAGRGALGDDGPAQVAALRGALDDLVRAGNPDHAWLRCELERELGIALLLGPHHDERRALLLGSLERSALLDPPRPRTHANALLSVRYALLEGGDLDERIAHAERVLDMPRGQVDEETRIAALVYLHEDLLRACRREESQDALERAERALTRYPHPYWLWAARTWRGLSYMVEGDLEHAEAVFTEALGLRPDVPGAVACFGVNLVDLRLHQERSGEVVPLLASAVEQHPEIPAYRAVLALCASRAGEMRTAAEAVHHFTDRGCANLPDDTSRFLALAVLAHAAADLADGEAAAVLEPLLEPFRDQWVVISAYGGGGAVWGPTAHALGRLAVVRGDRTAAASLLDRAAELAAASPLALARIHADRGSIT